MLPNEAAYRVLILAEAQTMTPQAQNALLKILEEPPAHVIFILTCENRSQLLETVRSRCVCLTLQPVAWDEAAPVLHSRLPQVPPQELQRAHSLFGGCIGQVISGITDGTLQQVLELTPAIGEAIVDPQGLTLLRLTARLEKERALTDGVLAGLILLLRDALAARSGSPTRLSTAPETALLLAGRLNGAACGAAGDRGEPAAGCAAQHEQHAFPDPHERLSAAGGGLLTERLEHNHGYDRRYPFPE